MLITEKIQKVKKNIQDFFKGFRQFFLKFNYPEAISKQLTKLIKCEKIEKIKKNLVPFFLILGEFSLEFNDPEAISKQLTVLKKC